MVATDLARRLIAGKSWHHDFEIIPGVRTHGSYNPAGLLQELELPLDMQGMSLADVGASNGYFSFEARKRGARVVAFDVRHKDNSGFALAQYINGLTDIEHHQINILDLNPGEYAPFDVVLAMGLLYHTPDPYRALTQCAALTRDRLVIESLCIDPLLPPHLASEPVMRFIADPQRFPGQGQPNTHRSNFWGFTSACLQRMVEDLGFVVRRSNVRGDRVFMDARGGVMKREETRLHMAYGVRPHVSVGGNPDDPEAWTIL
jgi:tRNA (mo5U34)-methyltransferase